MIEPSPDAPIDGEAACRLMFDNSPDCIKLLDISGRLLWINAPGCRLLEVTDLEPLLGTPWECLWPDDVQPQVVAAVAQARAGAVARFRGACPTFGGTAKKWDVVVFAVPGRAAGEQQLLSVSRDVTELVAAVEQHRVACLAAEAASRAADLARLEKEQLVATVSHELRSPLHAVLSWSVMLQASTDLVETRRIGREIESITMEQVLLVDELLDEHRSGGFVLTVTELLQVGDVVADVVEMMRPLIVSSRHDVLCAVRGTPTISGDVRRLKQVFTNLLANAIKFTAEGGRISVTCEAINGFATVTVSDTGRGVPAPLTERIFDPYYQETPEASGGGLGLGLSISRAIVALHHGSLTARANDAGAGTTFCVTIPLVQPAPGGGCRV